MSEVISQVSTKWEFKSICFVDRHPVSSPIIVYQTHPHFPWLVDFEDSEASGSQAGTSRFTSPLLPCSACPLPLKTVACPQGQDTPALGITVSQGQPRFLPMSGAP